MMEVARDVYLRLLELRAPAGPSLCDDSPRVLAEGVREIRHRLDPVEAAAEIRGLMVVLLEVLLFNPWMRTETNRLLAEHGEEPLLKWENTENSV